MHDKLPPPRTFDIHAYLIALSPEDACRNTAAALAHLFRSLLCVRALTADQVVPLGPPTDGTYALPTGATIQVRRTHSHSFNVTSLEVAILLSHLRAISIGTRHAQGAPFLVLEEDVECALLLGHPLDTFERLFASVPAKWNTIQAGHLAERQYMQAALAELAPGNGSLCTSRNALPTQTTRFYSASRSLSARFSPYWSAAAYLVSRRGAATLLGRYWPQHPSLNVGVRIDTRSQSFAAADSLVFNTTDAWLSRPLVTQRVDGSHLSEWARRTKASARDFVLQSYFGPMWSRKTKLFDIPFRIFVRLREWGSGSGNLDSVLPPHQLVPPECSDARLIRHLQRESMLGPRWFLIVWHITSNMSRTVIPASMAALDRAASRGVSAAYLRASTKRGGSSGRRLPLKCRRCAARAICGLDTHGVILHNSALAAIAREVSASHLGLRGLSGDNVFRCTVRDLRWLV